MDVDDLIREGREKLRGTVGVKVVESGGMEFLGHVTKRDIEAVVWARNNLPVVLDALEAGEAAVAEAWEQANRMDDASVTVIRMMARDWQKTEDERDVARAAIARVQALCDNKSAGPLYEAVVRRAIEGEQ